GALDALLLLHGEAVALDVAVVAGQAVLKKRDRVFLRQLLHAGVGGEFLARILDVDIRPSSAPLDPLGQRDEVRTDRQDGEQGDQERAQHEESSLSRVGVASTSSLQFTWRRSE